MKNIISLFDRINVRTIDGMNTTYSILDFCLEEVENQGSNSFLSFFFSFFFPFSINYTIGVCTSAYIKIVVYFIIKT